MHLANYIITTHTSASKTEAQRGEVTCLRSHSQRMVHPVPEVTTIGSFFFFFFACGWKWRCQVGKSKNFPLPHNSQQSWGLLPCTLQSSENPLSLPSRSIASPFPGNRDEKTGERGKVSTRTPTAPPLRKKRLKPARLELTQGRNSQASPRDAECSPPVSLGTRSLRDCPRAGRG